MDVVFVYGTLTNFANVSKLLEEFSFGPSAVCYGLTRVKGRYPTLIPGEQVAGRILVTPEIGRLDEYEGVDHGLYCRVSIPLSDRMPNTAGSTISVDAVETYIGDPTTLGISQPVEWSESGSFKQRVTAYVDSNQVHVTTTCD